MKPWVDALGLRTVYGAVSRVCPGEQRTASTFQWQLLCLLLRLSRGPAGAARACSGSLEPGPDDFLATREAPKFELVKTHSPAHWPPNASITLFCSTARGAPPTRCKKLCDDYQSQGVEGGRGSCRLGHVQRYAAVATEPLAEVQRYAGFFDGVGQADLADVRSYLQHWVLLRRCCGSQQSLSNRLRLHGCPLPASGPGSKQAGGGDLACEDLDLRAVEASLASTSLVSRKIAAAPRVGRCAEDEMALRAGKDFNGASFVSCEKLLQDAHIIG